MTTDTLLRFELIVSGNNYQTLVAHLRGHSGTAISSPRSVDRRINALVDLHADSNTFSITRIDRHRLPRPLHIRPGSSTHKNLTGAISRAIKEVDSSSKVPLTVLEQLRRIIDLCPTLHTNTLRADPNDFELGSALGTDDSAGIPVLARLTPTLFFDVDDSPTLVLQENSADLSSEIQETIKQALIACSPPAIKITGNLVEIHRTVILPQLPLSCRIHFFAHWGSYEDLAPPWLDELMESAGGSECPQHIPLKCTLHAPCQGWHGVTIYAVIQGSSERIWIGKPWLGDTRFYIERDDLSYHNSLESQPADILPIAVRRVTEALSHSTSLREVSRWLDQNCPFLSLGGVLSQIMQGSSEENARILRLLSTNTYGSDSDRIADRIRTTYGVGEIVFASPEGAHAGAGGLAQVLAGLPLELGKAGIPITIITPLYRYSNGHKHRSAEEVLAQGVPIGSECVIPRYVATISVHVGPTKYSDTGWNKRPPTTIQCKVYRAQAGRVRIFLISARSVFDTLYQPVMADEQLRRAIIFSRSVIETIATSQLGIRPSAIISNDWMTACIPVLTALDPAYQGIPWLARCKTIHMIHNGGADYHGRLPLHINNEDLWPMFNLAPEHYFGFRDPHKHDLINLTMAAVQHVRGGVITVSQPYAKQLVSEHGGGDGLEYVLRHKQADVFGISNGIKRNEIDTFLAARTGLSVEQLRCIPALLEAKSDIRVSIQQRYGLQIAPSATLVSFVGRLAEQKGLDLLSGFVEDKSHSTLEDILRRHSDVQILIAGPVTSHDSAAAQLCDSVHYLMQRYPGRISAVLHYIPHSTALEITSASTLFLMPSRFEPGGISQLEALAVGTPVVARGVGGIAATINNYDCQTRQGTGFLCYEHSPEAFARTTQWALSVCADREVYESLIAQALKAQHCWSDRAPVFASVLQRIVLGEQRQRSIACLDRLRILSDTASALS